MPHSIIQSGSNTVGVVSPREDGRALVFRATDPAFSTLDGSSFANRHAAQRAVDRIARLDRTLPISAHELKRSTGVDRLMV